ncbi:peptidoglycan DD-metalloendopeptidase family protein [Robiginitalea sediminis]|uniref:peptidoglycan DD-metalloendopeptidase family protein n=1 Tax=Robiginitalea sediminis TaxID=1982593 RepID=UPI001303CFBB|nr:peptidoglycan DD-metalloendopeptidase family protein [Robiginitalea sediminis]
MKPLLQIPYSPKDYIPIDLEGLDLQACGVRVLTHLDDHQAQVAYGGYLERRGIYAGFGHFGGQENVPRNIHLGVDFWAPAGTPVLAPVSGKVHSLAHRLTPGDYGPVILLEHDMPNGQRLFSLYGHLSPESLTGLYPGRAIGAGEVLGSLGLEADNGGYPPHLHFQLIRDLEGYSGDYPGVCSPEELDFYRQNCPDPLPFLKI